MLHCNFSHAITLIPFTYPHFYPPPQSPSFFLSETQKTTKSYPHRLPKTITIYVFVYTKIPLPSPQNPSPQSISQVFSYPKSHLSYFISQTNHPNSQSQTPQVNPHFILFFTEYLSQVGGTFKPQQIPTPPSLYPSAYIKNYF